MIIAIGLQYLRDSTRGVLTGWCHRSETNFIRNFRVSMLMCVGMVIAELFQLHITELRTICTIIN